MCKIIALILTVSLLSLVSCAKMGEGEGNLSVPTESSSIKTEPTVSETELVSEPEMGDTDVESIPVEPEPPESEPEEPETEETSPDTRPETTKKPGGYVTLPIDEF